MPKNKVDPVYIRVARGARWLDENFPGWENRIDLNTLDVHDAANCICGQVFKDTDIVDYGSGYDFARSTLLGDAGAWVSALVKQKANSERKVKLSALNIEQRAEKVAVELGFTSGLGVGAHDGHWADFNELTEAWTNFLQWRLATSFVNA